VTPQEYILSKRLFHARSIIAGGDFDTVAEVAFSVGFTDPLYFSKAYKKAYGISPSRDGRNE
jgi:AraC-like DNA-binding protein